MTKKIDMKWLNSFYNYNFSNNYFAYEHINALSYILMRVFYNEI